MHHAACECIPGDVCRGCLADLVVVDIFFTSTPLSVHAGVPVPGHSSMPLHYAVRTSSLSPARGRNPAGRLASPPSSARADARGRNGVAAGGDSTAAAATAAARDGRESGACGGAVAAAADDGSMASHVQLAQTTLNRLNRILAKYNDTGGTPPVGIATVAGPSWGTATDGGTATTTTAAAAAQYATPGRHSSSPHRRSTGSLPASPRMAALLSSLRPVSRGGSPSAPCGAHSTHVPDSQQTGAASGDSKQAPLVDSVLHPPPAVTAEYAPPTHGAVRPPSPAVQKLLLEDVLRRHKA